MYIQTKQPRRGSHNIVNHLPRVGGFQWIIFLFVSNFLNPIFSNFPSKAYVPIGFIFMVSKYCVKCEISEFNSVLSELEKNERCRKSRRKYAIPSRIKSNNQRYLSNQKPLSSGFISFCNFALKFLKYFQTYHLINSIDLRLQSTQFQTTKIR